MQASQNWEDDETAALRSRPGYNGPERYNGWGAVRATFTQRGKRMMWTGLELVELQLVRALLEIKLCLMRRLGHCAYTVHEAYAPDFILLLLLAAHHLPGCKFCRAWHSLCLFLLFFNCCIILFLVFPPFSFWELLTWA